MSADTGTVHRVLRVLSCFAEKDAWGINELARELELPRATAHRLLNLCRPLDFVTQDEAGLYRVGPELYRLAASLSRGAPLHRLAQPLLDDLRDRTDETVLLAQLVPSELRFYFSLSASPSHPLRYTVELNRLQPLNWGAAARVMLAHLSDEQVAEVVARAEPSPQDGRAIDKRELAQSLAAIRKDGFAITFGQRSPDSWGIAAPFFDAAGQVVGSVNITVPSFRMTKARGKQLAAMVKAATAELSRGAKRPN